MAYLCVNKDGQELICKNKPKRSSYEWDDSEYLGMGEHYVWYDLSLPKGSIEKLIGETLTWEDEPVEI